MYTITKEFHFSASHQLKKLHKDHPCMRNHGHNYTVIMCFKSATLDATDFVIDYRLLAPIKDWIDSVLDHRNLNDVMGDINTSSENIAKWIFDSWVGTMPMLHSVTIKETDKTAATYEK